MPDIPPEQHAALSGPSCMHVIARLLLQLCVGGPEEATRYFQKTRDVGAAHGFFSLESQACSGLAEMMMLEGGRDEEAFEILRHALVASGLGEDTALNVEPMILQCLADDALFITGGLDEVEPLVDPTPCTLNPRP